MEVACYVCNKNSTIYQLNLTEIKSNHSGKRVCDFIKQLTRDFATTRDVEDESNCICLECLQNVLVYDRACVEAEKQEKKLIELLLATEKSLSERRFEIKVEKDVDVCHTESVFVEENHGLAREPEQIEEDDVVMDEVLNTHEITTPTAETQEKGKEVVQKPGHQSTDKTMFIKKGGKLLRLKLVKRATNGEPTNHMPMRTNDKKLLTNDLEGSQTLPQAPIKTRKNVLGPKFAKAVPPKIVVSSQTQDEPSIKQNNEQGPASIPLETHTATLNGDNEIAELEAISDLRSISLVKDNTGLESSSVSDQQNKQLIHECKICQNGATYSAHGYQLHLKRHNTQCEVCDRRFNSAQLKRLHMRWYETHPKFMCRICHYKSEDKSSYKEHLALHKGKAKMSCVFCDKTFSSLKMLRRHIQIVHKQVRLESRSEHLCELCGKKYNAKWNLQLHKRFVHFEGGPVKCPKCPKMFKCQPYLDIHIKRHMTTGRSVACSQCDMKFKNKKYLRAHEKRHKEDTKTVKCPLCPAAYEHKFHLKEHIKRKHSAEVPSGQLDITESNTQE
ncbi:zinc finger protein 2-like isoform X2 [Sitodiplosis mosellana]|uniref:zinc finger protein 2-like isoform X2 n=1 Tax=Sitodiplosis mosellana TaxID=263140 RepID=UPI0024440728|nr:zinc finger protein 2-like isoform X2 [Sitodiplosis mosellana]